MSYYSNVRINLEADAFKSFRNYVLNYLRDHDLEEMYPFDEPDTKLDCFFANKDYVYFGWDSYNHWDENCVDDPDLSIAIMEALEHVYMEGYAYSYVREGEDVCEGDISEISRGNIDNKYIASPCVTIGFDDEYMRKEMHY